MYRLYSYNKTLHPHPVGCQAPAAPSQLDVEQAILSGEVTTTPDPASRVGSRARTRVPGLRGKKSGQVPGRPGLG